MLLLTQFSAQAL